MICYYYNVIVSNIKQIYQWDNAGCRILLNLHLQPISIFSRLDCASNNHSDAWISRMGSPLILMWIKILLNYLPQFSFKKKMTVTSLFDEAKLLCKAKMPYLLTCKVSKQQMLPFGFAWQYTCSLHTCWLWTPQMVWPRAVRWPLTRTANQLVRFHLLAVVTSCPSNWTSWHCTASVHNDCCYKWNDSSRCRCWR